MLRIRLLSGVEVATLPVHEVSTVRDVKRRLHRLHGLPPRFRQRLLRLGASLDDADAVDSLDLDMELVVLNFCSASQAQLDELIAAAREGSVEKAGVPRVAADLLAMKLDGAYVEKCRNRRSSPCCSCPWTPVWQ